MDRKYKKTTSAMSDPIMQTIKNLSIVDTDASEERTRQAENKLNSMLLPEEWLELSHSYLTMPPTLSNPEFASVLEVWRVLLRQSSIFNKFFLCRI
jgi:hypothetical protein